MRRANLLLIGGLLLLAACKSEAGLTTTYDLSFDLPTAADHTTLSDAALRVIERRMERIGEKLLQKEIVRDGEKTSIRIAVADPTATNILTQELQEPLNFQIMESCPEAGATTTVAGHGGFCATGIDDAALFAAVAEKDDKGLGVIILHFTPEGRKKLGEVFQKNNGKYIGLFVHNRLASKLMVETDTLKDDIVIRELPSYEIAQIFADDLNVGLHVTFTPVP